MKNTHPFTSADYNRIEAIVRPFIISKFYNLSQEDIDDIVSLSLLKIARSWHKYDESISKKSWFEVTAVRCAITYIQKEKKYRENRQSFEMVTDDGETYEIDHKSLSAAGQQYYTYADSSLHSKENLSYIKRAMGNLCDKERIALEMDIQGYSAEEIQYELGVSYANLRTIKSRGRAKLLQDPVMRGMMKEYFGRVA